MKDGQNKSMVNVWDHEKRLIKLCEERPRAGWMARRPAETWEQGYFKAGGSRKLTMDVCKDGSVEA